MGFVELFAIAVGLSMDAFAVAVCKGLSFKKTTVKNTVTVALWFGFFQAAMPLVGYFLGIGFKDYITAIDHYVTFILLGLIGANMIKESFGKDSDKSDADISFRAMLPLAVATSIDALAVGITFSFNNAKIVPAVSLIGIVTFLLSALGVKIGNVFGIKYKSKAELIGGIILIAIGVKILIEHLSGAA